MNKFKPEWRDELISELSKYPLRDPRDAKKFNLKTRTRVERLLSYANLLTEIARWESSFNPTATYDEAFKDRNNEIVVSTGLFQLSTESLRGYDLHYSTEKLKDPIINIRCAVKVFVTWLERDKVIARKRWCFFGPWRGSARYWSVLRGERDYTARALDAIREANK